MVGKVPRLPERENKLQFDGWQALKFLIIVFLASRLLQTCPLLSIATFVHKWIISRSVLELDLEHLDPMISSFTHVEPVLFVNEQPGRLEELLRKMSHSLPEGENVHLVLIEHLQKCA